MTRAARSVIAGSVATLAGTAISALLSLAYVSLGARWLGPAHYASVAAALSLANLFFMALHPLEAGLTLYVARLAGREDWAGLRAFLLRALRGLLLAGGVLLGVWGACSAFFSTERATFAWLGLFCCASLVGNLPRSALRGRELFQALAVNWILESAVRLGVGLLLLQLQAGPAGMVAGYACGTLASVIHGVARARAGLPAGATPPAFHARDALLPFRALSLPLLGLNLYTAAVVNVDVLAASHFLGAREAGLYGGGAAFARVVSVGANPLLLVLFSRLAALNAARQETRATQRLGALLVLGGLALSLAIPALGGRALLRICLGPDYADADALLLVQWATACVLVAQAFFAESLLATSKVRGGLLCALPAAVLVVCLLIWHPNALAIARITLAVCVTLGSATLLVLFRWRQPLAPEGEPASP